MNERELREHANCGVCGRPIGHTGVPLFWTLRVERHSLKIDAVYRQDGLVALLGGNVRLAQVMGTDAEMTEPMFEPVIISVCEACAVDRICLAQLVERRLTASDAEGEG